MRKRGTLSMRIRNRGSKRREKRTGKREAKQVARGSKRKSGLVRVDNGSGGRAGQRVWPVDLGYKMNGPDHAWKVGEVKGRQGRCSGAWRRVRRFLAAGLGAKYSYSGCSEYTNIILDGLGEEYHPFVTVVTAKDPPYSIPDLEVLLMAQENILDRYKKPVLQLNNLMTLLMVEVPLKPLQEVVLANKAVVVSVS
ncbi:hypothetical protein PIB30_026269 [Stylosanthes scabra]|uniref:Uncharacterized protein n=1 Tax=Stylosanthes scabra TaxID=79078 RepID=A0ABU6SA33_9FABA|nr:hypothetical protein [Stylosanthes scabra]